jgi:AraC-like DNA-binding protein
MPPTGTATVIVNLGEAFGGLPAAFAAGLDGGCATVEHAGSVRCLDLKLTPLGGYTLLGCPMDELTGRTVGLAELFGADGERLLDALREASGWQRRFEVLDGFWGRRAERGPTPAPAVRHVLARITGSGGRTPVGVLAEEVGWSRRHLVATFRRQVGLPPKTLARIVRFDGLARRLRDGPRLGLARLAEEAGYYDQAHLNRDFRQFAGCTPTEFAAAGVTSVQDGGRPAA